MQTLCEISKVAHFQVPLLKKTGHVGDLSVGRGDGGSQDVLLSKSLLKHEKD